MTSTIARKERTEMAWFALADPCTLRDVSSFGFFETVVLAGDLCYNV